MSVENFKAILRSLRGSAKLLYFHVKGEPLLHPDLPAFLDIAATGGVSVALTTNGTNLAGAVGALSSRANLRRVNVSLQAVAGMGETMRDAYLANALLAARELCRSMTPSNPDFLASLRLWTKETAETARTVASIEAFFGLGSGALAEGLRGKNGFVIEPGIAVHAAETFEWPSLDAPDRGGRGFCRGLRDQVGVLVDGTVVPCCLDGSGVVALGNALETPLPEILSSARARAIYDGFSARRVVEPLCRRCGYRTRFSRPSDR